MEETTTGHFTPTKLQNTTFLCFYRIIRFKLITLRYTILGLMFFQFSMSSYISKYHTKRIHLELYNNTFDMHFIIHHVFPDKPHHEFHPCFIPFDHTKIHHYWIWTIYEPYMNHIWTIYEPYMNHIWTIYEPYMNHIWTIYEPYMNHIWTIWHHFCCMGYLSH